MLGGAPSDDEAIGRRGGRRRRSPVWLLVAPALFCFGVSSYLALRQPLFVGGDERAHLLYTASIIDGRLPEFDEDFGSSERVPVVRQSLEGRPDSGGDLGVWVAYHPPLGYAVAAPVVWVAGEVGADTWPALAMRLVNAAATATGVVLAGLFAAEVFPARRTVGFAAACLTAVVPNLVSTGAAGMNDGVAFALSGASLYLAARLLRRRPTPGALAAACIVASAGMLTRVSLAPMAAMLAGAAFVSVWRHRRPPGRVGRALGAGLLVAATATVASGWFYWRNLQLYDRITAPDAPAEFARRSPGSFVEVLTGTTFHRAIWTRLYASVNGPLTYVHPVRLLAALGLVLVLGWVLVAARGRSRVRSVTPDGRADPAVPDRASDGIGVAGWVLVACCCLAIVVGSAQFYSQGGAPYPRYLFPVVPVVSALLARAVTELPCPRLVLAGVVGGLAAVLLTQVARVPGLIDTMSLHPPFDQSAVGSAAWRVPLSLALAAALATLWAGWRLGRGESGAAGEPGPGRGPPSTSAAGPMAPATGAMIAACHPPPAASPPRPAGSPGPPAGR